MRHETDVNEIKSYAFYGCQTIKNITINSNIKKIGVNAFYKCTNIKKLNFRGTIKEWCGIVFDDTYSNPVYYAEEFYINGMLAENLTINGVEKIQSNTFRNLKSVKTIKLDSTVNEIGDGAFAGCENLHAIEFCNSVKKIGDYAFYNCSKLEKIIFTGTENDWNNIKMGCKIDVKMKNCNVFFIANLKNKFANM